MKVLKIKRKDNNIYSNPYKNERILDKHKGQKFVRLVFFMRK